MAETVYNSKNTLTIGAVSFTSVSAPTVVGSTALYGVLAGSNTVAASTVTASTQFSGPGTGLTGTASSLNIGGSAGSAAGLTGTPSITVATVSATTLTGAGSGITSLDMGNAGSGTLAVARGGTGTTSSTGTGSVVLSASPTLTGTVSIGSFAESSQLLRISSSGGGNKSSIRLMESNDSYGTSLQNIHASRFGIFRHSASEPGVEMITIMRDNNFVGIGNTNPGSALQVNGTVTATTFSGSGSGLTGTASSLSVGFASSASSAGYASSAGSAPASGGTATYANSLYGNNDALIYTGGTQTSKFVYHANAGTNGSLVLGPNGTPITAGYRGVYMDDGGYTGTAISFQRLGAEKAAMFYTFSTNRIQVFNANSGTGVYLNASATSWTAVSDSRLKNIIEPISNAVAKVDTITPVIYSLKSDLTNKRRAGLIAQEILAILPEAVDIATDEDQTLSLSYTELVPLALAAIKELSAENTTLKAQMAAMDARLAALEAK